MIFREFCGLFYDEPMKHCVLTPCASTYELFRTEIRVAEWCVWSFRCTRAWVVLDTTWLLHLAILSLTRVAHPLFFKQWKPVCRKCGLIHQSWSVGGEVASWTIDQTPEGNNVAVYDPTMVMKKNYSSPWLLSTQKCERANNPGQLIPEWILLVWGSPVPSFLPFFTFLKNRVVSKGFAIPSRLIHRLCNHSKQKGSS